MVILSIVMKYWQHCLEIQYSNWDEHLKYYDGKQASQLAS